MKGRTWRRRKDAGQIRGMNEGRDVWKGNKSEDDVIGGFVEEYGEDLLP